MQRAVCRMRHFSDCLTLQMAPPHTAPFIGSIISSSSYWRSIWPIQLAFKSAIQTEWFSIVFRIRGEFKSLIGSLLIELSWQGRSYTVYYVHTLIHPWFTANASPSSSQVHSWLIPDSSLIPFTTSPPWVHRCVRRRWVKVPLTLNFKGWSHLKAEHSRLRR